MWNILHIKPPKQKYEEQKSWFSYFHVSLSNVPILHWQKLDDLLVETSETGKFHIGRNVKNVIPEAMVFLMQNT